MKKISLRKTCREFASRFSGDSEPIISQLCSPKKVAGGAWTKPQAMRDLGKEIAPEDKQIR
jgi:hypothetical protein